MSIKLTDSNLNSLPAGVLKPEYDRSALTPGIVHIGLGNFHRAHQAWYLHRLMQKGLNQDWAIVGAGVRPNDEMMRQKLKDQNYLTTLIELDPSQQTVEVCGAMIDYIPVVNGNALLIEKLADPAIRIVSLTVTEGGYYIDPVSKAFNSNHPDIQHDVESPEAPVTAFGAIIAALKIRREKGLGPLTCMSCDNLQGNGNILRQTIVSLAKLSDGDLADWINESCTFPNSMVDCIVPATGDKERALVQEIGIEDSAPVTHEGFRQWVIEDAFCAGRPDWDQVGVSFSDNVHGYELQKIRILNAGHQFIANVAEVMGLETISEAMSNDLIRAMFQKIEMTEVVPHIVPVPGMTPEQYVDLVERRFSNPKIVDTVRRVAFDGSSRHPGFVLPTVQDGLREGKSVEGLAFVEAAWARMCEGTRDDGTLIEPNDPQWHSLSDKALQAKSHSGVWLEMRDIYGDLADDQRFSDAFDRWLNCMYQDGMEAALKAYLAT